MIDLQLRAEFSRSAKPFVAKLHVAERESEAVLDDHHLAIALPKDRGIYECQSDFGNFTLHTKQGDPIDGDVLLCLPARNVARRLFRRSSKDNSLLFTERCDQLCVMCSQPPKDKDDTWLFPLYEQALHIVDPGTMVGITGGEPTLYKDQLLEMIERVYERRPDLSYHILSNGQHFSVSDTERLTHLHERVNIVWGIPLYSHNELTEECPNAIQGPTA